MSTIEIGGFAATRTSIKARSRLRAALGALWHAHLLRRARKRDLALLRRLDAYTLRDMGFEPAEIYGSRVGTIGAVHGDAWKGLDH